MISFRIYWFDLLVILGTLKSLLKHDSPKISILGCSALTLQLTFICDYCKNQFTRWTFVGIVMSLLFNTLSRFVIAFLPNSKHLLILWLQSSSAVILESKKINSVTVSIDSPSICHEVMGLDAMIFVFEG